MIAATTTRTGLRVRSELDTGDYPAGLRVGDAEMERLYLQRNEFHGGVELRAAAAGAATTTGLYCFLTGPIP